MDLPEGLPALLHRPSPCFLATTMPDGSPQLTQTRVDTDGTHVLVDTVAGCQEVPNTERDPRAVLNVADPDDVSTHHAVRGRVVSISAEGSAEHIDRLAQEHLGGPYPWYGGRDPVRLTVRIAAERISSPQG